MEFGICLHSIIPVRQEASHLSPMVTQILFGELYRVIEKGKNWFKIHLVYDEYEGWIDGMHCRIISSDEFFRLDEPGIRVTTRLVHLLMNESRQSILPIVLGSSLPGLRENHIQIDNEKFYFDGEATDRSPIDKAYSPADLMKVRQQLVRDALLYYNAPYLWGGRSPFGIDCSGFVQMVYKLNYIKLSRDARQQAEQGGIVSLLAEAGPGDLAFFDDEEGNITHVGLLADNQNIIHCSGNVHTDTIDHEGIYNRELQKYTHRLRLIKRIALPMTIDD
ncbi:MAG: C40 family peptidase [Bacteroidota bacterium]